MQIVCTDSAAGTLTSWDWHHACCFPMTLSEAVSIRACEEKNMEHSGNVRGMDPPVVASKQSMVS